MEANGEWKQSLDNRLDHLLEQQGAFERLARIEDQLAHMRTDLADVKEHMVSREDFAELTKSMTHYAAHVEHMLNAFSGSHLSLEERFTTLERRVAEIEKRIPPQQAA